MAGTLSPAASGIGFGRVFVMRDARTGWVLRGNGGTEPGRKLPPLVGIVGLKGDDIIIPQTLKCQKGKCFPIINNFKMSFNKGHQ